MYICIYINIYIYRRANGIYIQKSCSIWTVCPCYLIFSSWQLRSTWCCHGTVQKSPIVTVSGAIGFIRDFIKLTLATTVPETSKSFFGRSDFLLKCKNTKVSTKSSTIVTYYNIKVVHYFLDIQYSIEFDFLMHVHDKPKQNNKIRHYIIQL